MLEQYGSIAFLPQSVSNNTDYLEDKNCRAYNIWLAFFVSVPLCRQGEAVEFLNRLYKERTEFVTWLKKMEDIPCLEDVKICKRSKDIINTARSFAKNDNSKRKDRYGKIRTFKKIVKENIRNFLLKEEGTSLYRIIRDMKKWNAEQKRLAEQVIAQVEEFNPIN
jgi:hypothetical protein